MSGLILLLSIWMSFFSIPSYAYPFQELHRSLSAEPKDPTAGMSYLGELKYEEEMKRTKLRREIYQDNRHREDEVKAKIRRFEESKFNQPANFTAVTGAVFSNVSAHYPNLGQPVWQEPNRGFIFKKPGLIWSGVIGVEDYDHAKGFCEGRGARLPSVRDMKRLIKQLGWNHPGFWKESVDRSENPLNGFTYPTFDDIFVHIWLQDVREGEFYRRESGLRERREYGAVLTWTYPQSWKGITHYSRGMVAKISEARIYDFFDAPLANTFPVVCVKDPE